MPTLFESDTTPKQPKKKQAYVHPAPSHMRPMATFAMHPDNVRFETQEPEETVELFLREHIVVNIGWIIVTIILVIAPTILFPFFLHFLPFDIPGRYIFVGSFVWYLLTFGYALGNFLYWFFNIYVVTNERVVDIDFLYLLYKRLSEAEIRKIQDISYTSGGILATIFDYGNVSIETAGESPNIEFEKVPHPEKVVECIRALIEENEGDGKV